MVDFSTLMLDPIFAQLGVPGVVTLSDSRVFNFTVIDKTAGVDVGNNVQTPTVLPCAALRYSELTTNALAPDDLIDANLLMNGFNWTIRNSKKNPNTSGEKRGELLLMLSDQTS